MDGFARGRMSVRWVSDRQQISFGWVSDGFRMSKTKAGKCWIGFG